MAETALRKSRDINEIKKYRGAIKGQISSALSKLQLGIKTTKDFTQQTFIQRHLTDSLELRVCNEMVISQGD